MQLDYFFFYTEANIVCIVILAILLVHDRFHSTRQEKQIWFNWALVAHFLYFISDIGWAAVISGHLPRTRGLVILFNFLNYVLLSLMAYEWFMYMAASEGMGTDNFRKFRIQCLTPMAVSLAAMIIAYVCAPTFWVSEEGVLNDWYYPMMISAPALYLTSSFIISLRNARRTESRDEKKLYRLIGIYPMGIMAFGMVQTFALNAPLFCFGCTTMMMFFYIQNMQALVSVDSLTRLNNRGQINRYMDGTKYRENMKIYTMMIDVDRFKEINDTWGHAEGDKALILVSDVLKQAAEKIRSPVFIGRYGGDEFTVFIQCPEGEEIPEQMIRDIREMLEERQKEIGLPYDLKVSVGYDALRDREDTMEACMERADGKLYEDKKGKGR